MFRRYFSYLLIDKIRINSLLRFNVGLIESTVFIVLITVITILGILFLGSWDISLLGPLLPILGAV